MFHWISSSNLTAASTLSRALSSSAEFSQRKCVTKSWTTELFYGRPHYSDYAVALVMWRPAFHRTAQPSEPTGLRPASNLAGRSHSQFRSCVAFLDASVRETAQPFQGSKVAHLDGAQAEIEHGGDLGEREIRDVADLEDSAFGGIQAFQRILDPLLLLVADSALARARTVCDRLVDDRKSRPIGRRWIVGSLARDGTLP